MLAIQIARLDYIVVDKQQLPRPEAREHHGYVGTEAAEAGYGHAGGFQLFARIRHIPRDYRLL
jgi:hypothetical protein